MSFLCFYIIKKMLVNFTNIKKYRAKTKRKVYFKAPPTVHKKIGIGDIVIFSVKGKKYHVLIIQVYKPTELNREVSFIQPNFKPFF
ncbi:hypothetical protein IGJ18_002795 [Enterococcus sp. AZ078]